MFNGQGATGSASGLKFGCFTVIHTILLMVQKRFLSCFITSTTPFSPFFSSSHASKAIKASKSQAKQPYPWKKYNYSSYSLSSPLQNSIPKNDPERLRKRTTPFPALFLPQLSPAQARRSLTTSELCWGELVHFESGGWLSTSHRAKRGNRATGCTAVSVSVAWRQLVLAVVA